MIRKGGRILRELILMLTIGETPATKIRNMGREMHNKAS
jgi:hypothetical protein